MKKELSLLLAVLLAVSCMLMVPQTALAADSGAAEVAGTEEMTAPMEETLPAAEAEPSVVVVADAEEYRYGDTVVLRAQVEGLGDGLTISWQKRVLEEMEGAVIEGAQEAGSGETLSYVLSEENAAEAYRAVAADAAGSEAKSEWFAVSDRVATEQAAPVDSPAAETVVPTTEATEPSTEATEPVTEATEPSTEATEPVTEAAEPSTEAAEPSTEATEPVTEATEPSSEETEPATEPTEPAEAEEKIYTLMELAKLAAEVTYTAEAEETVLHYGDTVTVIAQIPQPLLDAAQIRWQMLGSDGWYDVEGTGGTQMQIVLTEENAGQPWRIWFTIG